MTEAGRHPSPPPAEPPEPRSSEHVLRALRGDLMSLEWVVLRFTPLLLAQAEYRLGPALRRRVQIDAEDVVQDVWAAALPNLDSFQVPHEAAPPASLLRYLSTALLRRIQQIAEKHLRRTAKDAKPADPGPNSARVESVADSSSTPASKAIRGERCRRIREMIDSLDDLDRQILILRGVEQSSLAETAAALSITPNAAAVRYHRALKRLRERLPDSVFDDLAG